MQKEGPLLQEIRINTDYSHLGYSEYESDHSKKKSKPVIKNKSVLTNDYMQRLTRDLNEESIILPPNCRYVERTNRGTILIIEEPPAVRTVRISIKMDMLLSRLREENKLEKYGYKDYKYVSSKPNNFTLAFPYVIFILFFNDYYEYFRGKIFIRAQQMTGLSDVLLKIPMLNINSDQNVCMGDKIGGKRQSLYQATKNAIDVWWGSSFNFDYRENYGLYQQTPIINNYLEWQYFSQENPMFIFSVDWFRYNLNMYQTIEKIKTDAAATTRKNLNYTDMVKIFNKPIETGTEEKPKFTSRKTYKLYYDIAQSVYLEDYIILNVGDPVVMKNNEVAFIYSFIGFIAGGDIKYIQLEKNGHLFKMAFNDAFKKFMLHQIHQYRFTQSVKLKNGNVVKPGDILTMTIGKSKVYKKVDYIRRGRSSEDKEIFEIKTGAHYYLSDEVDATVFSMKNPTLYGIKVKKNTNYLFIKEPDVAAGLIPASQVKFEGIDVSQDGTLHAKFNNSGKGLTGEKHSFRMDVKRKMPLLLNMKEVRPLNTKSEIFRVGRQLYYLKNGNNRLNYGVWAYNGTVLHENYYSIYKPKPLQVKTLIKDDTFSVPGPDFDTEFSIGDKVIVANWHIPINVLNVKTIQGFKYDSSNGNISFVLLDNGGTLSEEIYVIGSNGFIQTGYIRKVTNKFDKLSVGTKIIAKASGVCNFPKKDANIVVAILIDGPHEPLVLCSNGCTLWYSTIMKDFEIITMKSKKWKTLKHSPLDVSKIKFQSGDIINGRRDYRREGGYIIFDPSTTRFLKCLPITYYQGYPDYQTFDKYFSSDAVFESIPLPRLTVTQQTKCGVVKGWVDFHGGVIEDYHERSQLPFINERSGINV